MMAPLRSRSMPRAAYADRQLQRLRADAQPQNSAVEEGHLLVLEALPASRLQPGIEGGRV
jgi:hypothetical protein